MIARPSDRRRFGVLILLLATTVAWGCNPDRDEGGVGDATSAPDGGASTAPDASAGGDVSADPSAGTGGALEVGGALTTMGFGYESGDEIAQVRVDTFKEQFPDVEVTVQEGGFDEQAFLSSVASGDAPDAVYLDRNLVGTYAARGAIQPLGDCLGRAGIDMSVYREAAVGQVTLDDEVYAIPEFYNTRVIMIDGDIAEEAGIDPATFSTSDWDAVRAFNEATTQADGGDVTRIGFDPKLPGFLPLWAKANGADVLSADGRESLLDDPKVAEALTFAKELYDVGGGKTATDAFSQTWDFFGAENEFVQDQLGAMPMEQWYINVLAENSPDTDVVFRPFEARDGSPLTFADGNAWAIPTGAANPDAACQFLATMTAAETWIAAAEARAEARAEEGKPFTGTYTANSVADEEIFGRLYQPSGVATFDEGVQLVLDNQDAAFSLPASPAAAEFDAIWRDAVDRVLTGGEDPATALQQADEEAQAALDGASTP
jgi:multiple sugar transport system substrate-binding protein